MKVILKKSLLLSVLALFGASCYAPALAAGQNITDINQVTSDTITDLSAEEITELIEQKTEITETVIGSEGPELLVRCGLKEPNAREILLSKITEQNINKINYSALNALLGLPYSKDLERDIVSRECLIANGWLPQHTIKGFRQLAQCITKSNIPKIDPTVLAIFMQIDTKTARNLALLIHNNNITGILENEALWGWDMLYGGYHNGMEFNSIHTFPVVRLIKEYPEMASVFMSYCSATAMTTMLQHNELMDNEKLVDILIKELNEENICNRVVIYGLEDKLFSKKPKLAQHIAENLITP